MAEGTEEMSPARELEPLRRQVLAPVSVVLFVAGLPILLMRSYDAYHRESAWAILVYLSVYATVCAATLWRRVPYPVRVGMLLVVAYGLAVVGLSGNRQVGSAYEFLLVVPFLATLLYGRRAGIVALAVVTMTLAVFGFILVRGALGSSDLPSVPASAWIADTAALCLIGALLIVSLNQLLPRLDDALAQRRRLLEAADAQRTNLESLVEQRTQGLYAVAEVGHAMTSLLDAAVLLPQVVELVRERFGLYYVGLFLVDEARRFAVLHAGTGAAGREMLARGHRLEVGGRSMVGRCAATGVPDVQLDVGKAVVRFDNPFLPWTRSELALPLRVRGRVIGVLTVQSEREDAFDEAYVALLQTMADQVAVAVDNARLFAESQAALAEMRAIQQRYVEQSWREYLRMRGGEVYATAGMTGEAAEQIDSMAIEQALTQGSATIARSPAAEDGDPNNGGGSALVLPVTMRGEIIGIVGIDDADVERQWSDEDVALAEAVVERLAIAAENLRLLDDTQASAAREQRTAQIGQRVREALDVEEIIRVATETLAQELGASEVVLRLGSAEHLLSSKVAE
ncbi:MAG: GAF domain-containing protein [Anaerolineae bacterium]